MPKEKKKIKNYSVEDMKQAISAVKCGASVSWASKEYKIPRITLLYKVKGKYDVECRMGPETTLTWDEEKLLVKWLLTIASLGFPATKLQLLDSVQLLVEKLNRANKLKNNRPGNKWYKSFLKRHPELSERVTQNLTKGRSEVTEQKLRGWFDEIQQYFTSKNFDVFEDPRRVYNCDETAFFLAPKEIIKSGFKTCGLFPLNPDSVPYQKHFKLKQIATDIEKVMQPISRKYLQVLEERIGIQNITEFKAAGDMWQGDVGDTSLFTLWRQFSSEVDTSSDMLGAQTELASSNINNSEIIDQRIPDVLSDNPAPIPSTSNENVPDIREKTPDRIQPVSDTHEDVQPILLDKTIPSPFKSTLFWPKLSTPQGRSSSDSSIDYVLESEGEGDNWDTFSNSQEEDFEINVNDYVVVKYEDQYYPGKLPSYPRTVKHSFLIYRECYGSRYC
ncbi:tc5 transposase dna-binding domain [Holotrichia oblita]|uniref:Tc5 transposase dna-binding domain n=1 Tax=Holotrichia oblita TaxID=644536 RepID=A0ACB9TVF6_HOLOL|nr:tc5 transposase dna-binding domain [Holotrichia oblita]